MKFFNKKFMLDEHIIALRESRKVLVKNKYINYNDNFIELVNMESGLRVFPENDELLDMINNIERFDADWNAVLHASWDEYRNYRYEDLPAKLKRYMWEMDALFFARWMNKCKRGLNSFDYDSREERLARLIPAYTDDDFERYVVLGHSIPTTLGKKAKDSARRSYKTVSALFKSNVELFSEFVTLTFASASNAQKYQTLNSQRADGEYELNFEYINAADFEETKAMFTKTIKNLSRSMKRKGIDFHYIAVWEIQTNGNYHFHMLCSEIPDEYLYKVPTWLDYDYRKKKFNDGYGLKYWEYGKSDVQKIQSREKISTYVSKYIIKSFINLDEQNYLEYMNKKKYFTSKNLNKPVEEYISDKQFEKVLRQMEIAEKVAYEKEYINSYNLSAINKKIYTLL